VIPDARGLVAAGSRVVEPSKQGIRGWMRNITEPCSGWQPPDEPFEPSEPLPPPERTPDQARTRYRRGPDPNRSRHGSHPSLEPRNGAMFSTRERQLTPRARGVTCQSEGCRHAG